MVYEDAVYAHDKQPIRDDARDRRANQRILTRDAHALVHVDLVGDAIDA